MVRRPPRGAPDVLEGRAPQGQDARGAVVGPGARAVVAVLGVDAELDEAVAAAALEDRRELFEEQLALDNAPRGFNPGFETGGGRYGPDARFGGGGGRPGGGGFS